MCVGGRGMALVVERRVGECGEGGVGGEVPCFKTVDGGAGGGNAGITPPSVHFLVPSKML